MSSLVSTNRNSHARVVVYVPTELHALLKAALALQGRTISSWFREEAARAVSSPPPVRPRRRDREKASRSFDRLSNRGPLRG